MVFSTFTVLCSLYHSYFINLFIITKRNCIPMSSGSSFLFNFALLTLHAFSPTQATATINVLPVFVDFPILPISYRCEYMIFTSCFFYASCFQGISSMLQHRSILHSILLPNIFHCVGMPHFTYQSAGGHLVCPTFGYYE